MQHWSDAFIIVTQFDANTFFLHLVQKHWIQMILIV